MAAGNEFGYAICSVALRQILYKTCLLTAAGTFLFSLYLLLMHQLDDNNLNHFTQIYRKYMEWVELCHDLRVSKKLFGNPSEERNEQLMSPLLEYFCFIFDRVWRAASKHIALLIANTTGPKGVSLNGERNYAKNAKSKCSRFLNKIHL